MIIQRAAWTYGLCVFLLEAKLAQAVVPSTCDLSKRASLPESDGDTKQRAALISQLFGVSVLIELEDSYRPAHLESQTASLSQIALSLGPHLEAHCVANNVLSIYDEQSQQSRSNALNYSFRFFSVPLTFPEFRLNLLSRLATEPWRPFNPKQLIQPGQGYLPSDYKAQAIAPLDLRDVTAREVVIEVATQIRIISVLALSSSGRGSTADPKPKN